MIKPLSKTNCAMLLLAASLLPAAAHATSYSWTGTTSTNWALGTNWGGSAYPNGYGDTATISSTANNPVSLATLILLGAASGNALTIGTSGSGTTANLDITSAGTLGMQGNISITTPTAGTNKNRGITIEGTLRNDGTSGTSYTVGGTTTTGHGTETLTLNNGTITTLNGGGWNFASPVTVTGYGTISAPFTGTVTTSTSGQAINITSYNGSPMTIPGAPTLSFTSANNSYFNLNNVVLGISGNTGTAVTLAGTSGRVNTAPMAGSFNNNWGNNLFGLVNVTGNTTINGAYAITGGYKVLNVTNSTLTLNNPGTIPSAAGNTNAPPPFVLGTGGNLVINGTSAVSMPISALVPINGGALTYNGSGAFNAYGFTGFGNINQGVGSGPMTVSGGISAQGGTLVVDGTNRAINATSAGWGAAPGATLDLKGNFNVSGWPGFYPSSGGAIRLDSATINGTSSLMYLTGSSVDPLHNMVMIANSGVDTLIGNWNNTNTLQFNSNGQLDIASGTGFANTGLLDFKITGTGPGNYGVLDNLGSSTVGGSAEFDLTGFSAQAGESWEFYLGDGWGVSNSNITVNGLASGLTWEIDRAPGGEILQIDAVPEPTTLLLVSMGLIGLAVSRRKFIKS